MKGKVVSGEIYDPVLETMSRQDRVAYQTARLRRFVSHAYRKAPAIRARLDRAGVRPEHIRTIPDLEKIPPIHRTEVIELQQANPPFGGLLAVPPQTVEMMSVGTGPVFIPHQGRSWQILALSYYAIGFRRGDVIINTFSFQYQAGIGGHAALQSLGVTEIATGVGNTDTQVQIMRQARVTGFVGSPGFLVNIIQRAEAQGYDLRKDFRLRVAYLAAETVPVATRRLLETKYGLRCGEGYGTSEGQFAFECSAHHMLHVPDQQYMEICDPETGRQLGPGEVGEIVGTAVNVTALPLLRFATGDLSFYTDEPCPCGRTSRRISRILGRTENIIKVRGIFLYPRQLAAVLSEFADVVRFQATISRPEHVDKLTLRLELRSEDINQDRLKEAINNRVQETCKLRVDQFSFVTLPPEAPPVSDERKWD